LISKIAGVAAAAALLAGAGHAAGTGTVAAPEPAVRSATPPSTLTYPVTDTFATRPLAATPRPGSACEAAGKYAEHIGRHEGDKIADLFAEDGEMLHVATDKVYKGRAEINALYTAPVSNVPSATPISFIDSGAECFMELGNLNRHAAGDKYLLSAIDHFTVNPQGQITRLIIYFRPKIIRMAIDHDPSIGLPAKAPIPK
jgi:hypothetical protein